MRRIVLGLAATVLSGCASTYSLQPLQTPDLQVRYDRGAATLLSIKDNGAVRVAPMSDTLSDRMVLAVVAFNRSGAPVNLGYENVAISLGDGTPVRLFTYDQLRQEANTKAAWAAVGLALSAAANGYAASQAAYSSSSGMVTTSYGSTAYFRTNSYNPGVALALNQANAHREQAQAAQIGANLNDTLAALDGSILRTTTIDPGMAGGGQIVAERPRFNKGVSPRIDVRVTFNGEVHQFSFLASQGATTRAATLAQAAPPPPVLAPTPVSTEAASYFATPSMNGTAPPSGARPTAQSPYSSPAYEPYGGGMLSTRR